MKATLKLVVLNEVEIQVSSQYLEFLQIVTDVRKATLHAK